ncbi:hypothetical protein CAter10_1144 [Collimonas arenae]|uniref:hypothetical protein n=1 Tax=Collimonas arenae TaxID=279058 RepID=UPI0007782AF0|nr:hypothetical protein [Collimonas arenae]AMO98958.1 hypothetical protein CAter10_1144 [Collimonas arenae]
MLKQQSTQSAKKTGATSLRTEAVASTASTSTYTYLRCFYRTNNNPTKPTTTYVWGLDRPAAITTASTATGGRVDC